MHKTAVEKATEFLGEHFPKATVAQAGALTRLLIEQDRDTRHACAEAVINAPDPHAACMNVIAV